MASLTILANDFPIDINDTLAGAINSIEGLFGNFGVFFIHKLAKIAFSNFAARVTKYATECIIEKKKIAF